MIKNEKNLSLQEIAESIGGNYWERDEMRRVYLDKGYNTKNTMSTKTWIEEKDGELAVKCFVECPSQHINWIKSQQQEIIKDVERELRPLVSSTVYVIRNEAGEYMDDADDWDVLDEYTQRFGSEEDAQKHLDNGYWEEECRIEALAND